MEPNNQNPVEDTKTNYKKLKSSCLTSILVILGTSATIFMFASEDFFGVFFLIPIYVIYTARLVVALEKVIPKEKSTLRKLLWPFWILLTLSFIIGLFYVAPLSVILLMITPIVLSGLSMEPPIRNIQKSNHTGTRIFSWVCLAMSLVSLFLALICTVIIFLESGIL